MTQRRDIKMERDGDMAHINRHTFVLKEKHHAPVTNGCYAELVENRAGALAEGGDYKRLNQRE